MYKSIPGLDEAFTSVCAVESTPRRKRTSAKLHAQAITASTQEGERIQDTKSRDLQEANKFYAEFGKSTSKIAAKLREIDSIGLSDPTHTRHASGLDASHSTVSPGTDKGGLFSVEDEMSNQQRFMKDQATRAQALLPMEYYMRQLHATETTKQVEDVDERIAFHAKQWKLIASALDQMENDPEEEEDLIIQEENRRKKIMKEKQSLKGGNTPRESQKLHSSGLSLDYVDTIIDKSRDDTERADTELVEPFRPPVKVMDVKDHVFLDNHPMIIAGELSQHSSGCHLLSIIY